MRCSFRHAFADRCDCTHTALPYPRFHGGGGDEAAAAAPVGPVGRALRREVDAGRGAVDAAAQAASLRRSGGGHAQCGEQPTGAADGVRTGADGGLHGPHSLPVVC